MLGRVSSPALLNSGCRAETQANQNHEVFRGFGVVGKMLRAEREKTGLSQEEFSELVSLSKNYIGNIERGEYEVSLSVLLRIARALKRSASDLLAESGY